MFFNVHPYLGKIPILTNIFQMGWTHQLVKVRKPLVSGMKSKNSAGDDKAGRLVFLMDERIWIDESSGRD